MSKKNTILESIQHIFFDYEITTSDFKESEAFEFYKIILENRTMISLMKDNYYELNKTLKIHDQVIEYSEFDHNIKNKHKLQKKITRQFSNYLQSLFSIVDYNRRIIEKILKQNTSVNDIYLKRKEDFKKNKYHKLISNFRNYYAHFTYLKIGSEISYKNNSMHPTKSIIIYKIDLLSDTGLSSYSRELLSKMPEKIRLNDIVSDHYLSFLEFQNITFLQLFLVDESKTEKFILKISEYYENIKNINSTNHSLINESFLRYIKFVYFKAINESF